MARRALLTEHEREALSGETSDDARYVAVSRIRKKIDEELTKDVEVLQEYDQENGTELIQKIRAIVCEDVVERHEQSAGDVGGDQEDALDEDSVGGAEPRQGDLVEDVKAWIEDRPPRTSHAKQAVLKVFSLLRDHGTMKTGELKDELWEDYSDDYGGQRAMWESVSRHLESVPGVEKGGYGEWEYTGDEEATRELSGGAEGTDD